MRQLPTHSVVAGALAGTVAFLAAGTTSPSPGALAALTLANDSRIDPSMFRITEFIAGLPYASGTQRLPDGSLLVGVSVPTNDRFRRSIGSLLRLTDEDGDGVADDRGTVVATDLPGGIVQMRQSGEILVINSQQVRRASISFLRAGDSPDATYTLIGSIDFRFPEDHWHDTYALAVRPSDASTSFDLFFNVGSALNATNDSTPVPVERLLTGELRPESIYVVNVVDDGTGVSLSEPTLLATGLRNAAGIALHPSTGDLYFNDNGIDVEDASDDQVSADELNVLAAADVGSAVQDYGFASNYVEYRTGRQVGSAGIPPLVAFQPAYGHESEGPVEIAFAPEGFPDGLNDGIFVTFHGTYDLGGVDNIENPLMYVNVESGEYFPFIPAGLPNVGHLDSVLAIEDALFITDLNREGSVSTASPNGVIYQIQARS
jgi:glucose/arabinose dehydrogenase